MVICSCVKSGIVSIHMSVLHLKSIDISLTLIKNTCNMIDESNMHFQDGTK